MTDDLTPFKWSPSFAYAVGLLATDGYLSSDGRHMELCSKDLENILNLRQCLNLQTKIGRKTRGTEPRLTYHRTQFGNVRLYRFLVNIGLGPRKSRTLQRLAVPRDHFADFLRGVWDGDGCITAFQHPESYRLQWRMHVSSGSPAFLKWLQKEISQLYGLKGTIFQNVRAQQLVYYKHGGARLVQKMYYNPNVICLARKREKALSLLDGAKSSPLWGSIHDDTKGHVAKLGYAAALGAAGETRGGSNPSMPIG